MKVFCSLKKKKKDSSSNISGFKICSSCAFFSCLFDTVFFLVFFQYWPAILHSEFFFFPNDLTIDFT